jgi:hypothetical protein
MPLLPLPSGETSLTGGDLPVSGPEDVLAEFARPHRTPESAPVRDAFVAAWDAGQCAYQNISARAAAQTDPMRATGEYQRSFAEERGIIPGANESEESVRARLFRAPEIVTPNAIRKTVNAIIADFADAECTVSELDLDGQFIHDGTATWDSFCGAEPNYPDRYYDERPWLQPGGAVPSSGDERNFLMRIPVLDTIEDYIPFVHDGDAEWDGVFVHDGTAAWDGHAVFEDPKTAEDLYRFIIGTVNSIKGQGIPWTLVADPTL